MGWLLFRWLAAGGGVLLISWIFPGIEVRSVGWALITAVFLGLFNAVLRPILLLLTLPLTVATFGLFALVINALLLWLAGSLLAGFSVSGFWSAFGGALVLTLISLAAGSVWRDRSRGPGGASITLLRYGQRRPGRWEQGP